ncbi:MAG: chaperonin GroEL [Phycisphaerae bacterium]|nr:chaperonin GroEL [Phycisphaerae bacterium]
MPSKQMLFEQEARQGILAGLEKLAATVKVTMGPTGRNVILQKSFGSPRVTKDGVTVSKEVELPQPFENMGAKLVNEVASKTSDIAGDGTTTAVVLAETIYREGLKAITAGANPMAVKRGIDLAVGAVIEALAKQATPIKGKDDIAKVATVSANGDETVGRILSDAFEKVGKDGVIEIEEGKSLETEWEHVEGMQFDKGYISPYFFTNRSTLESELEEPYILIHEKKISNARELIPLLEKIVTGGKPLLIIAEDVEAEALAVLVMNHLQGGLRTCAVKAPGFGDRRKAILGDIATVTGATVISEDLGIKLEKVELGHMGRAKRVVVDKDYTTIVEGAGKKGDITQRIDQIRGQIAKTTSDYDREKLQERLAKLTGGVAVINVGGATEVQVKERKDLVEDAFHTTRAAVEEGVVPGGGVALLSTSDAVAGARNKAKGDEKIGVDIIARAIEAPARQIAENAGVDGGVAVAKIRKKGGKFGFDGRTGEIVDMVKAGIIDAAKVTRSALQNAASISGVMLTTDVLVTELKDKEEEVAGSVR